MESPARPSPVRALMAAYLCLVLAMGVARFASAPDYLQYQLFLLLLPPAAAACFRLPSERREGLAFLVLGMIGLALLGNAALRPTTEARGYVLASIGWLAFSATLWLASERRILRALYLFVVLLGAAEALYGLAQAVGGIDRIGTYVRGIGRVATGTYINRNHFAGLLNMCLSLALGALFAGYVERRQRGAGRSETFAWTWLIVSSGALVGLSVFLSLSRGGSLVLLATLLFVFILLRAGGRSSGRQALPARVAAMLLVATLGLSLSYGLDALLGRFDEVGGVGRLQVYRDTLRLISDHPWNGVGPGMYRFRFRAYQTSGLGSHFAHAHSDYLQSAAEWGIPLALLFWGFVVWRLARATKLFVSARSPWRRGVGLGCAAAIAGVLLHSLVDFNLQIPANLAVFAVVLGLGWAAESGRGEPAADFGPGAYDPPQAGIE